MPDLKQPYYVPEPANQPQVPGAGQPVNIRPGSRLAVLGVFLHVIRMRFDEVTVGPQFQFRWRADIKKTRLAIESAFNEDKEHRGFRPAVTVDVDEQVAGRVVLGDRAGFNMRKSIDGFWNLKTVPLLIECVAAKRAESAILADLVGNFIEASSDLIQAKFGLHDLTPVTTGRTQPDPNKRDKDEWITPVTLVAQYPGRWTNERTAPLLREVEAQIIASGADDATSFFESIAIGPQTSE